MDAPSYDAPSYDAPLGQVATVVRLLHEVRPDLVYLPHAADASFDHHAGFELVWRALGMGGSRNFSE